MLKGNVFPVKMHKVVDVALTGATFVAAYVVKRFLLPQPLGGLTPTPNYYGILLLVMVLWCLSFEMTDLHESYRRLTFPRSCWRLFETVTVNLILTLLFFYLLKVEDVSRILMGIFFALNFATLALSAWIAKEIHKKMGFNLLVVIIGSGEAAKEFIERILREPDANFRILGCLEVEPQEVGKFVTEGVKVIGSLDDLQDVLTRNVVDEIIFAMPIDRVWEAERYMAVAEAVGVRIRILPHWPLRKFLESRPTYYSMHFEDCFESPSLVLTATSKKQLALLVKGVLDYLGAAILLAAGIPLGLFLALSIQIVSPGPVFYKQLRCGLYGRRFAVYKLRTMVPDAEKLLPEMLRLNEAREPVFKIKDDPRIIPGFGKFMRRTGLDELPQLFNVLRGEMSLVGPRPPTPNEVDRYKLRERRRLSMKPGLTCLWQVTPHRNRIAFEEWLRMDLEYIDHWSLWLDFKILCLTVRAVLCGYGL